MSRRRPLLGAVAGLLAVALGVSVAPATQAAQEEPDPITCDAPTPAAADVQDSLRFEPIKLNADVTSAEATQPIEFRITNTAQQQFGREAPRVDRITASIVSCRNGQVLPTPSSTEATGGSNTLAVPWSADFTWNREYDVIIDGYGSRPQGLGTAQQHLQVIKRLRLAVPPKKPTGVKASTANGVVTVSWSNAEREPDLIAYEVRRTKQGSNDYVTVKDGLVAPTVHSVPDQPGEGAYRYQVIAHRQADVEATSTDATVEIAAPASSGAGAGTDGASDGSPAASSGGDGTATGSGGTTGTTAKRPAITTGGAGGTVDLSNFAAVLNARRTTPTTRVEPPDPGFDETLPFQVAGDDPAVGEPEELGSGDDAGLGERLVADPDARRRSLGFVAFGLLLFVLGMTGLFLKGEVNRADELEAVDDDEEEGDDAVEAPAVVPVALAVDEVMDEAPALPERRPRRPRRLPLLGPDPSELDEFTPPPANGAEHDDLRAVLGHDDEHAPDVEPATANGTHRRRRTVAPLDAPGLDVPDPASTTTTRTHARRASSRLPARPADDRRQGRAAVRAGGGGTGEGDRRVPVGR